MTPALAAALRDWQSAFTEELSAQLYELRDDTDIYGFAVEVPEDLSNLDVATAVGRESKLAAEKSNFLSRMTRRYCPVEWDYLPDARAHPRSTAALERISRDHGPTFSDDSAEDTPSGLEFRDALYRACLDAMATCDAAGAFGRIGFKMIFLSDGAHPIVRESIDRLNPRRNRWWRQAVWLCVR